jgi:two-component sensor histidine kinase
MTFHELAVNAARYGALSVPGGRARIAWSVDMAAPVRTLRLEWREEGGPPVSAPARMGFGRRLIERGVARDLGGAADLDFAPEGVRFTLETPLSHKIGLA